MFYCRDVGGWQIQEWLLLVPRGKSSNWVFPQPQEAPPPLCCLLEVSEGLISEIQGRWAVLKQYFGFQRTAGFTPVQWIVAPSHRLPLSLTITTTCRADFTGAKLHIYFPKLAVWERDRCRKEQLNPSFYTRKYMEVPYSFASTCSLFLLLL